MLTTGQLDFYCLYELASFGYQNLKIMKKLLLITFFGLIIFSSEGQVSGIVKDATGQPMSHVNALLLQVSDSSLVTGGLTNLEGVFLLEAKEAGQFFVKVSFVGFADQFSEPITLSQGNKSIDLGTFTLVEEAQSLDEVTITAQKILVEQIPEGKVLNIQNSVLTKGSTALQVLERSPGIVLDRRNNVLTLNGQQGTLVMINGRTMRMSQADLINMLSGMTADNIESIELLTNPSARYDADGGAGIINIKLKKNRGEHTQGSVSAGLGYGWSGKETLSANLSTSLGENRIYATYAYNRDNTISNWHAIGTADNPFFGFGGFDFQSETTNNQRSHNINLGLERDLNESWVLGGNLMLNPSNQQMRTHNFGLFDYEQADNFVQDIVIEQEVQINNFNANAYADKSLDGGSLSFSLDYLNYDNSRPSVISSAFLDEDGNPLDFNNPQYATSNRGESQTKINLGVAQIDFSKQLNDKLSFGTGLKNSYSSTENEAFVQRREDQQWVTDELSVSNQNISENIIAGYVTATYNLDSLTSLSTGLRYENWTRDYGDPELDGSFGRLFPSAFLSRKLSDKSSLQLAYNRRVTRPTFNDLASFVVYNNPVSVFTGNPLLQPTITDNFRLGWQIGSVNLDLVYTNEENPIVGFQQVEREDGLATAITPQNLDYQRTWLIQTNIPINVNSWWSANVGGSAGTRKFRVLHTAEQVEKRFLSLNLYGSTTILLPKDISLELSGFFNGDGFYGTMDSEEFGTLNAGLKRNIGNHGTLQFTVTDVLQTMRYRNQMGGLTREAFNSNFVVDFYPESNRNRIFRLTYTRSFGNGNTKGRRGRGATDLEEKSRLANN